MKFWLKFVSIASIAGVFAWAASAAPLQIAGNGSNVGYGYGAAKVTICHIPPGNPSNAHTITVGAPAVAAHLAHGDTLGPCPAVAAAAPTAAGTQENTKGKRKSKHNGTPTAESTTTTTTTTTTTETSAAPAPQQKQKPMKEKPAQSHGVGHTPAPTTDLSSPSN